MPKLFLNPLLTSSASVLFSLLFPAFHVLLSTSATASSLPLLIAVLTLLYLHLFLRSSPTASARR